MDTTAGRLAAMAAAAHGAAENLGRHRVGPLLRGKTVDAAFAELIEATRTDAEPQALVTLIHAAERALVGAVGLRAAFEMLGGREALKAELLALLDK